MYSTEAVKLHVFPTQSLDWFYTIPNMITLEIKKKKKLPSQFEFKLQKIAGIDIVVLFH